MRLNSRQRCAGSRMPTDQERERVVVAGRDSVPPCNRIRVICAICGQNRVPDITPYGTQIPSATDTLP